MPSSRLAGVGAYAPDAVISNADLEKLVDTNDDWIRERTGIAERRRAAPGETTTDMALVAARRALEAAGLTADDLDMIIVGTVTPDYHLPAAAAVLLRKLGVKRTIPAFDVAAACAGFLFGMTIAERFIRTGTAKHVLVVGVELLTSITNYADRGTCILFGDGAGAAILSPSEDERGFLSSHIQTDPELIESLWIPAGGTAQPITPELLEQHQHQVHMNGQEIFRVAVKKLAASSIAALEEAGLSADQVDWVVPHQANMRIIKGVSQRLGIPMERFVVNIERYGNTSSASIPLALYEAMQEGRVKAGDTILMCALGAGISWGSAVVRL